MKKSAVPLLTPSRREAKVFRGMISKGVGVGFEGVGGSSQEWVSAKTEDIMCEPLRQRKSVRDRMETVIRPREIAQESQLLA